MKNLQLKLILQVIDSDSKEVLLDLHQDSSGPSYFVVDSLYKMGEHVIHGASVSLGYKLMEDQKPINKAKKEEDFR